MTVQDGHLLFVEDKSPQVDLQVVSIHLHLLETILAKCPQSHTLQKGLWNERIIISMLTLMTTMNIEMTIIYRVGYANLSGATGNLLNIQMAVINGSLEQRI